MSTIRALIVDDEPLARENLRVLVDEAADLELVGQCANGFEAVEAIKRLRPDLLFLDVKMPKMSGFDVLQHIDSDRWPFVVFVTAYDHYAVKAFELNALDYLQKPFDDERFAVMLSRARDQIRQQQVQTYTARLRHLLDEKAPIPELAQGSGYLQRLVIRSTGRISFVEVAEVEWVEAAGSYVYLHTAAQKHLMRAALKTLAEKLNPHQFIRIHRSTLVNVAYMRALEPFARGDYYLVLKDNTRLRVSRRYRHHLERYLGELL